MKFQLDTNVCIHVIRPKGNASVKAKFGAQPETDLAVAAVSTAELRHGAAVSPNPAKQMADVESLVGPLTVLPFDDAASVEYARIRADLEVRGMRIGDRDMMIAAVALVHDLTLVTHNTAEFGRIPGLKLDDWEI